MASEKDTLVAAYTLKGKLVKTYPSAIKAAKVRHVFKRTIDRATRGDILTVKNLQWRRVNKDDIPQFIEPLKKMKITNAKKKVGKLSETGEIVEIYPSLSSAAKANNIDPHTLRDRLNHKYQNKGKTQFVYIEE